MQKQKFWEDERLSILEFVWEVKLLKIDCRFDSLICSYMHIFIKTSHTLDGN